LNEIQGYGIGESLKDIGTKGTTLIKLRDLESHLQEFDRLWSAGKPL
jgi:hypothetical protein